VLRLAMMETLEEAKCADESEAYEIERIEWVMASASSRGDEY
jgi:hypothetical protein